MIVPKGANANTPVIGYAPGTHGLGDQCAPSRHLEAGDETEGLLIHQYATRGYAVAVTDYEGIGTPGEHTYMAGRSEGNATLDGIRTALRLPGTGLSATAPVAVVGYSQGGHASGWAAQVDPSYAPELAIKAYAVGAPPADLLNRPEWHARVVEQNLGGATVSDGRSASFANPAAPVLLYHSNGDEILPVQVSVDLRAKWCAGGSNVTFWRTSTGGHFNTAAVMSPAVTSWVADRLAGRAPTGNC